MQPNFRSDNESPAAAEIMAALEQANRGTAWSYAEDRFSRELDSAFSKLFGTTVTVIPLSTGTAANSIALSCMAPSWGSVYCHSGAHIYNDEGGAPEFFGHGLRLVGVPGANGKLQSDALEEAVHADEGHGVHSYVPSVVSLTQSTEAGTIYQPDEIHRLCSTAGQLGMHTHMDGARFANAVASLGCHPADVTWKAGVDMLSFGATKNGCMGAEALVIFGSPELQDKAERQRKRSGHLLSKMRYVSAQLLAYIEGGLWLRLADNANRQAARFAAAIANHPQTESEFTIDANEVFLRWTPAGFEALENTGVQFLMWPGRDDLARFVFSHVTTDEETRFLCDRLADIIV